MFSVLQTNDKSSNYQAVKTFKIHIYEPRKWFLRRVFKNNLQFSALSEQERKSVNKVT